MQSLRFHLSVLDGDVNAVRECIDNGMDPLLKDQEGNTVLHWAAHTGDVECLALVLEAMNEGVSLDIHNIDGSTPLHCAALSNQVGAVQSLLNAGADPNATNLDGQSPLHAAVRRAGPEIVQALCEKKFCDSTDVVGHVNHPDTALHWLPLSASLHLNKKRAWIPQSQTDLNLMDAAGFTPLHVCTFRGLRGAPIWTVLVNCGADPNKVGGCWGSKPIHPVKFALLRMTRAIFIPAIPLLLWLTTGGRDLRMCQLRGPRLDVVRNLILDRNNLASSVKTHESEVGRSNAHQYLSASTKEVRRAVAEYCPQGFAPKLEVPTDILRKAQIQRDVGVDCRSIKCFEREDSPQISKQRCPDSAAESIHLTVVDNKTRDLSPEQDANLKRFTTNLCSIQSGGPAGRRRKWWCSPILDAWNRKGPTVTVQVQIRAPRVWVQDAHQLRV
mmetsp:Transcript_36498/g.70020  ORF Transcript_36498/g.70020 Transcript_36498/m.70020 type:complete len:442 (-) Transcript_36498:687-2012(-)